MPSSTASLYSRASRRSRGRMCATSRRPPGPAYRRMSGSSSPRVQPLPHSLEGGDDGLRLQGPAGAGLIDRLLQLLQHLGQLAVREQASVGEDQNPSPFPSRSAAPAAQVLMSPRPTRPSRVR